MKVKAVIFATGMLLSTSLLANDADMHIAALNNQSAPMTQKTTDDADDEIGSTDTSGFDNRIGAFSRADGAMMGAYGDGEYAE